jgi:hypothetical protein
MTTRDVILHGTSPYMATTLMLVGVSFIALLLSWVGLRLAMPILIERMGN